MRRAFINIFFPPSLFNRLLLEIRNFSQRVCESLTEAWLRLKNMLLKCHGHGLAKGAIIQIFYHGLDEPTQGILDVTAGGIFLYKTPNQVFQFLDDKVLFEHDWPIKSKNEHHQKSVSFADGSDSNTNNSRFMEKLKAMDSQIISLNKELQDIRHQNRNSYDSFSHQSLHDPNDSEKSLTELNNDVKNDLKDFKRCIRSMRIVHWKLYDNDDRKTIGVLPNKNSKTVNQEPQSKTDFEKLMTRFLDDQRVSNMFVKNNVKDMILKMKQNEKNFQTKIKNMERKIDEWSKSQNVSSKQTDRNDPPPPQAHTEHGNAIFTESGKNGYLRKGQKSKQNDKTEHENGKSVKEKSKSKPSEKSTVKVNPTKSRKKPRKSKAKIKDLGGQERLKAEMMLGFSSQEKHNKHKKEKTKDLTAYILKKRTEDKLRIVKDSSIGERNLNEVWLQSVKNGIYQDLLNTYESSNDDTNVVNAPREPFVVKQCFVLEMINQVTPPDTCFVQAPSGGVTESFVNDALEEQRRIAEDQAAKDRYWKIPICYDDDEDYTIAITPVLLTEEPVDSLIMEDEHLDTIPATESDEVIKSSVENLVPIPSESEGISDDTCDVPVGEDSFTFDALSDHSEILSDSNDDGTSSDDDSYEDIEYVEASPPDLEIVSLEEVNDVDQKKEEFDLENILQIQDVILREKLLNINRLIANIESLNDNNTPRCVLKFTSPFPIPDSNSFFEKSDTSLSYSDNSLPEFESFSDHTEETSSGSTTTHANNSLPEYD
ncbi:hypothetical protein Tco_0394251 [Tanacetum coccineum]